MSEFDDITYEFDGESSAAIITTDRPDRYNAFRGQTVDEMISYLARVVGEKKAREIWF